MGDISSTSLGYLTSQDFNRVTQEQWSGLANRREVKQSNPKKFINAGGFNRGWILKLLEWCSSKSDLFCRTVINLNGFNEVNTLQFSDLPQRETPLESQEITKLQEELACDPTFFDYQSQCVREYGYIPENRSAGEIQETDPNNSLESFKGLTGEDIETVMNNHLEAHPEDRIIIGDAVQFFEREQDDARASDKIP